MARDTVSVTHVILEGDTYPAQQAINWLMDRLAAANLKEGVKAKGEECGRRCCVFYINSEAAILAMGRCICLVTIK